MEAHATPILSAGILGRATRLFAILAIAMSAAGYPFLRSYETNRQEVIETREVGYLYAAEQLIKRDFFEVIGDLGVITHLPSLKDYLVKRQEKQWITVAGVLRDFSEYSERYAAIQLLDTDGRELLRIDRSHEQSVAVPPRYLKEKPGCGCMEKAIELGRNGIFVSPITLAPVERSLATGKEPIVYFARAVSIDDGPALAVVALHFRAREMLDELRKIAGQDHSRHVSMMISKEGRWISNSLFDRENAMPDPDDEQQNFANRFPAEWEHIHSQEKGKFLSDNGLFLFSTVYPLLPENGSQEKKREAWNGLFSAEQMRSYYAKLVRWVPADSLAETSLHKQPAGQSAIALAYLFLALLCLGITYILESRRREENANRHAAELELQAYTDSLTAVWNRRYFQEVATRELLRNRRSNDPLVLLILDIDHFKCVNDTYGHKAGDIVLKEFCIAAHQTLRETDIFARLGGEEFVALLPNTNVEQGQSVANRLREAIAKLKIRLASGEQIQFTVSIGMSCLPTSSSNLEEMLNDADRALYEAKHQGRNRVCLSSSCRISPDGALNDPPGQEASDRD